MAVSNVFDWFVYNEVSIEFGEGKTDSIAFASNIQRKDIKKRHIKNLKLSNKLKVLYPKSNFLTPELAGLLCNASINFFKLCTFCLVSESNKTSKT